MTEIRSRTEPSRAEPVSLTPASLTRVLIEEQRAGRIGPDLRLLIEVVARACKRISIAVGKGALGGVLCAPCTHDAGSRHSQAYAPQQPVLPATETLHESTAWGR